MTSPRNEVQALLAGKSRIVGNSEAVATWFADFLASQYPFLWNATTFQVQTN